MSKTQYEFLTSTFGSGTRIQNLGLRVCWYRLWSSCRRKPFQALAGLSRSEFACGVSKNKRTAKAVLLFLYRAAEKDIARKSLRYKGFRRFLMHFSLLPCDLNKTTGILLSAKKDITLFSRQFAKPMYYGWSES